MNLEEHEYGYLYNPPDAKEGDQCRDKDTDQWMFCPAYTGEYGSDCRLNPDRESRRLILPGVNAQGQECEIVGLKEIVPDFSLVEFTLDGIIWTQYQKAKWNNCSIEDFITGSHVLAIRRPKQQVENVPQCSLEPARPMTMREQLDANKQRRLEEQSQLMHKVVGKEGDASCDTTEALIPPVSSPTPEVTKGVQPTQTEQDEKLCEELRVAFHTATEMGLPFSASALDTAIKRIRELSKPAPWIAVSQCDLKPGETFWSWDGFEVLPCAGDKEDKIMMDNEQITHFMRATGQYQIPPPPKEDVRENPEWRKWWNEYGHIYSDVPEETSRKIWESMVASRESLNKGKEGGK